MYKLFHTKQNVFWNLNSVNHLSPSKFKEWDASDVWVEIPNMSINYKSTFTGEFVVGIDVNTNYFKQIKGNEVTYWYVVRADKYTKNTKTLLLEMDIYASYIVQMFEKWNQTNDKLFVERAHLKGALGTLPEDEMVLSIGQKNPYYLNTLSNNDLTQNSPLVVKGSYPDYDMRKLKNISLEPLWLAYTESGESVVRIIPIFSMNRTDIFLKNNFTQGTGTTKFNTHLSGILEMFKEADTLGKIWGLYRGLSVEVVNMQRVGVIERIDKQGKGLVYLEFEISGTPLTKNDGVKLYLDFINNNSNNGSKLLHKNTTPYNHHYALFNYLTSYVGSTEYNISQLTTGVDLYDLSFTSCFMIYFKNVFKPIILSPTLPLAVDKVAQYLSSIQNQYNVGTDKLKIDSSLNIARSAIKGGFSGGENPLDMLVQTVGGALMTGVEIAQSFIDVEYRQREWDAKKADMYNSTPNDKPNIDEMNMLLFETSQHYSKPIKGSVINIDGDDYTTIPTCGSFSVVTQYYDNDTLQSMSDIFRLYGFKIGRWVEFNKFYHDNNAKIRAYFIKLPSHFLINQINFNSSSEVRSKICNILKSGLRLWNTLDLDFNYDLEL